MLRYLTPQYKAPAAHSYKHYTRQNLAADEGPEVPRVQCGAGSKYGLIKNIATPYLLHLAVCQLPCAPPQPPGWMKGPCLGLSTGPRWSMQHHAARATPHEAQDAIAQQLLCRLEWQVPACCCPLRGRQCCGCHSGGGLCWPLRCLQAGPSRGRLRARTLLPAAMHRSA